MLILKELRMKTKTYLTLRIILGIVLILLAGISTLQMIPPRAVPADAPASRFSAERAMADLQVVAIEPHGAGTEAQAHVRDYIVGQVDALGLNARVESSGQISNILVRLQGTDSTQTVLVSGHYDSHPPAPGAGDDGISVVAMLETMRVLRASQPLRNDILFLFTDGEELGWKGAYAFIKAHPEVKNETGAVLCFDARPGNGPLAMWETSLGDAWLVRQMTGLPLSLWAGSWTNRAERGEIDTDCSVFFAAGYTGVEIENAEKGTRYHTPRDTVDAISPNLVQSYGKTMLVLANHFGATDLRTRTAGPDLDYSTLPLVGLVAYPTWLMPVMSGLGLAALLGFIIIARRRRLFLFGRFGWGLLGLLLGTVLIVLCAQLAWGVIRNAYADELAATGVGFEASTAWLTGLMLAATILMIVLLAFLSRRLGGLNLLPAVVVMYILVWLAVYLLMDADNPFTTAYIALPMLGGVAGMGVLLFIKNPAWKAVFLSICALAILILMVPQLWLAAFTREDAWIPVLATCLPAGFFVPQVDIIFGRKLITERADQVRIR
jgi:hypothetical protein